MTSFCITIGVVCVIFALISRFKPELLISKLFRDDPSKVAMVRNSWAIYLVIGIGTIILGLT